LPPALIALAPAIIGGASSIAGAKLSSGKRTSTQENRAYRDPMQEAIQAQLAEILKNALANPGKAPQWMINQGKKQVNSSYNNALPNIERTLAKRGFETSGKLGGAARDVEMGRATAMQDLRAQLSQFADQRFQQMLQYAMQFQRPEGSNVTSTQSGPSQLGPAIAGIGGDIATMLNLRNMGTEAGASGFPGGVSSGAPSIPGMMPPMDVPSLSRAETTPTIGKGGSDSAADTYSPAQPLTNYKVPAMDEVWNQIFGPSAYKPLWKPEPMTSGGGGY